MGKSTNTLGRFFTVVGIVLALSLAHAVIGCSGQGMRTEKTNGTGGGSPGGASGNMGSSVGFGGQGAGDSTATGGTTGTRGVADAGSPGGGGSTGTGGARGAYSDASTDAAGVGGAGGHIVMGDGGGGSGIDGSRPVDATGVFDGPGVDDGVAAGSDSGTVGGDSGKVTDAGGIGDAWADAPEAGDAGRDTPNTGDTDSGGPQKPFAVSPQSVDLGNILVGESVQVTVSITAAQTFTDLSVTLEGSQLSKDAASTCTANLGAGETCSVVVNFSATYAGTGIDSLIVSAAGQTVVVPVQSVARTPAELLISPPSAQFSATMDAASSSYIFAIGNGGDSASGPLVVAVSGVDAWLFSVVNSTCTSPLAPGGNCRVTLVFNPRVADGGAVPPTTATATLTVTDTGMSASVASAKLTGNVTGP